MKFSAALSLAVAPVALAKAVHNVYPVRRDGHLKGAKKAQVGQVGQVGQQLALPLGMAGVGITQGAVTEVIIIWANPGANAATTTVNQQVTVTQTVTQNGGAAAGGAKATAAAPPPAAAAPAAPAAPPAAAPVAPPGAGATHAVTVGGPAGLQFTPAEIKANVGDMVVFTFLGSNHTASQSGFETPCDPLAGGMDSGFQTNVNSTVNPPPQVAMQVMVQTPLWFYCKQSGHCGKGMTFSINPTAEKSQAIFQQKAIQQKGAGAGGAITGNGAAPAAAAPAAPAAPAAAAPPAAPPAAAAPAATAGLASTPVAGGVVQGTGAASAGVCVCAVTCSSGSFPAVQAQGLNSFGGFAGALPANMLEV